MGLDAAFREQLTEARKRIIAQIEEIEFRVKSSDYHTRNGPPGFGDVYTELENQLREINELLHPNEQQDS